MRNWPCVSRARTDWQATSLGGSLAAISFTAIEAGERCVVLFSLQEDETRSVSVGEFAGRDSHAASMSKFECIFSSNETRFGGNGDTGFDRADQTVTFKQPGLIVLKVAIAPSIV